MRCPVASCAACHTSGLTGFFKHMKVHLSSRPANDASAAVGSWRQVVRSPAFVGLFLAVLILLLAWLRLTGPSWTTLQMPFDLRESEGNTVQWEQIHHFVALRVTLRSDAAPIITGHYGTDHYRGLLPIYVSAILSWWLDSSYKGFALVDLLGWWFAAWTLYYLARRLETDHLPALMAAVLLVASPLLISHMWRNAVHVVHSASLVPCFLAALLLLTDKRLAHGWRVCRFGECALRSKSGLSISVGYCAMSTISRSRGAAAETDMDYCYRSCCRLICRNDIFDVSNSGYSRLDRTFPLE